MIDKKVFCRLCKHNDVFDNEECMKMIDSTKINKYNGKVISGKIYFVNKNFNAGGNCRYFEKEESESKSKPWYKFWEK